MKKHLKIIKVLFCIFLLTGCNGSDEKKDDPAGPVKRPTEGAPEAQSGPNCQSNKIQSILNDGRTIVSAGVDGENALVLWDVFGRKVRKRIDYIFNDFEFSNSGDYILRKVGRSSHRFQILSIIDSAINYTQYLHFRYGSRPRLGFSHNEKYIHSFYHLRDEGYKLLIYDIAKKDFIFGKKLKNLKYVKMADLSSLITIQTNFYTQDGGHKITFRNLETGYRHSLKLVAGKIQHVLLSESILVVRTRRAIYIIDMLKQEITFKLAGSDIIDLDHFDKKLLVKNLNGQLDIIDLKTGTIEENFALDERMDLSSCKLNYMSELVLCKSLVNQEKLIFRNFVLEKTKEVCLE